MITVMQLALTLSPGGTERLVIEISKRIASHTNVLVCCLDEPGAWAKEVEELGIKVMSLHRRPGFHPSLGWRIAKLATSHGVDVLHCHQYSPFVYGQIALLHRSGLRMVFTEHGRLSDAPPSWKRKLANVWLGRRPAAVYAVSADLRRHMIAEGFPADRVQIIYNGIEIGTPVSDVDRRFARESLEIAQDRYLVGTVARLDLAKDLGTLIEAFMRFRRNRPDAELVIVGDGPDRAALAEAARRVGVAESVHFLGQRPDVRHLLPALDLYANSSITEGVSLTILEAMAASLPVVATRVGGTPEVVIAGETGLLVPARDAQALAEAMVELAGIPQRARLLGDAGRRRVEARFTLDRMVEQYLSVYRGMPP